MGVSIELCGDGYCLSAETSISRSLDEVFEFFSDAMNLDTLTPRRLRFEVLTKPPIVMREGLMIDYRLRLRGLPIRWTSEITAWEPPYRFVDEQRRGPYRWWRHEHLFEYVEGATRVIDQVEYGVTGGHLVHGLFVRRDLLQIFAYRCRRLQELMG